MVLDSSSILPLLGSLLARWVQRIKELWRKIWPITILPLHGAVTEAPMDWLTNTSLVSDRRAAGGKDGGRRYAGTQSWGRAPGGRCDFYFLQGVTLCLLPAITWTWKNNMPKPLLGPWGLRPQHPILSFSLLCTPTPCCHTILKYVKIHGISTSFCYSVKSAQDQKKEDELI